MSDQVFLITAANCASDEVVERAKSVVVVSLAHCDDLGTPFVLAFDAQVVQHLFHHSVAGSGGGGEVHSANGTNS